MFWKFELGLIGLRPGMKYPRNEIFKESQLFLKESLGFHKENLGLLKENLGVIRKNKTS